MFQTHTRDGSHLQKKKDVNGVDVDAESGAFDP